MLTLPRRQALIAAAAASFAGPAVAQTPWMPSRPVRLIVPFVGGGATDVTARILAERMGVLLGQPVVVDNRPGAGGNLGADIVAKADPDGHTLLMCTIGTASINRFLYARMPFDPDKDLTAVANANAVANAIVVNPQAIPATDLRAFLALARARPGAFNYATPGNGTSGHMCGELLKVRAGIDIGHVPYRGTGAIMADLLAGRVELAIDNLPAYLPHIREGRLRILAVTSRDRWFAVPETPTVIESGVPDFVAVAWFGIQAPGRTPRPIVDRLGALVEEICREPATASKFRELGAEPMPLGPDAFTRWIAAENAKWQEVVRVSGARLD
ncbi:Bug family tripartite tricarboxylate transporter substrate binding protein [Humitalea sp. 24SJ18S-53]|uniref:Bug family tripartite tricarboxylate transporter substrate binding protein n=1 Tax=Humitalea sp. 24SJ18S-53 TaxID=3422307 RepID=UPI003D66EBFD